MPASLEPRTLSDVIRDEWDRLSLDSQEHIARTRPALLQRWELQEHGCWYLTVGAEDGITSLAEALAAARDNVERRNYDNDLAGTLYIDVVARNTVTGERDGDTVILDPEEPVCADRETHDWHSPYSVLGGDRANPGVWGHGGGVIVREVCRHCGTYRLTDTWAQRMDTGEQGLTTVSYAGADDE